ncbi:hypothetical protein [Thiopseudomonas alkaliphila]|uniref:hypothetical protein n=1 Tax=Thiopseudomonas alkaliphila TaxID=1697053 RepID=UPI002575C795|nr:hypothetical protein [Thiopseudomonas alkaliphila]MDM1706910.1 hypothetical protein [Thiopseudomonas alkaliphila]
MRETDEQIALDQALAKKNQVQSPVEQVQVMRKQQLDVCALKRSDAIDELLKSALEPTQEQ